MRVLFLTHRLPYAPNRGDRVRSFHIVRCLVDKVRLTVVSLAHDESEIGHAEELRRRGAEVLTFRVPRLLNYFKAGFQLATRRPLTHMLLDAPGLGAALEHLVAERRPDVVLSYCTGMARFALHPSLCDLPMILDMVDVDSAKWSSLATTAAWPRRAIYRR